MVFLQVTIVLQNVTEVPYAHFITQNITKMCTEGSGYNKIKLFYPFSKMLSETGSFSLLLCSIEKYNDF